MGFDGGRRRRGVPTALAEVRGGPLHRAATCFPKEAQNVERLRTAGQDAGSLAGGTPAATTGFNSPYRACDAECFIVPHA